MQKGGKSIAIDTSICYYVSPVVLGGGFVGGICGIIAGNGAGRVRFAKKILEMEGNFKRMAENEKYVTRYDEQDLSGGRCRLPAHVGDAG